MAYVKFHDPWNSGSCCGTPDAGPDTPITKGACNHWETGIFNAAATADTAIANAAAAQSDATTALGDAAAADANANNRVLRTGDTMSGPLTIGAASGTTANFLSVTAGDTVGRFAVLANGSAQWSDGTNPADVILFRGGANILQTADEIRDVRALATDTTFVSLVNGDGQLRFRAQADGKLQWGDGTAAPDTDLFRSSAGVLRTGSQFSINKVGTATDAELRLSRDAGNLANIRMRTGVLDRWGIQTDGSAEAGAAAGSNLMFQRYDDAGVFVSNVLNMNRATGVVSITSPGNANGAVVSVDGTQSLVNKVYQGSGSPSSTVNISMKVTGDTQVRYALNLNGDMSWSPGSGAMDAFLKRSAAGVLQATDTSVQSLRASTGLLAFQALVSGDTNPRWQVTAGGTVSLGPGNAAVDFSFARVGVNIASVSGVLQYTGTSGTGGFSTFVTGDTVARIAMLNNGILFGPGNAVGDSSLIRVGVGILGTQGFQASGAVSAAGGFASTRTAATVTYLSRVTGDANDRWDVTSSGVMGWGSGSAAVDVTMTRSGTAELTMVGALRLNGNVGFYNTAPVAKPTVTGSKGANAALTSLLTALASQGLITDSSS